MRWPQRIALFFIRTRLKFWSLFSPGLAAKKAFRLFCTPQRRFSRKPPPVFEHAEPLQWELGKIRIQGWRWNKGGSRRVLICHGFESSAMNFDRYVKPLVRKGYEVLAFDAPAHGKSGGREVHVPLYAQMIREIDRRYGPVQSYMAHSFGALSLALAMEQMPHTPEHRLVFIAPATETSTAIDHFFRFLKLDTSVREAFEKRILQKGGVPAAWYSIRRAMGHIRATVLWVHDTDDDSTPLADALHVKEDNFQNITFMITSGLGHRRIYRDNKVTRAVVNFL